MVLTAGLAVKLLRQTIADYNFWPQSEGDSLLSIKRGKQPFDDLAILSRDASMRRAATKLVNPEAPTYKPPANRAISYQTLDELFQPLIRNALTELATVTQNQGLTMEGTVPAEAVFGILMPIEAIEYLTELYQVFSQLQNPKVIRVSDDASPTPDAYTTLMIVGESMELELIIAQTLLIQT